MNTEIELKLDVDPADLPLVRRDPFLANAESHVSHQVTVYYDTPETKLRKRGFTLRVRSAGGTFVQTVKPISDSVGLLSREEVECEVASLEPDLEQLSQHPICALLGKKDADRLREQLRSEVTRTSWQVDQATSKIEIDLDHGTIIAGGRSAAFAELEFELCDGLPASLIMAARRLSDFAPVRLGVLTKAERGFRLAGNELGKVYKAEAVKVHAGMDVAQAFETIVHACLKHYRLNEAVVLSERKAAALHQARVAMRRLRSALTLFRPAIEDVEFQHLRHHLRWFTAQLGDARNVDVYLERDLPEDERAELIRQREQAYEHVSEAMNSQTFRRLLIDLVGWTAIGAWRGGKLSQEPIESFAKRRLDRLWKSIIGRGRNLASMDEVTRHELRIEAKKLRYAVEFLQGVYSHARAAEKRFASAVEELQESLGKLNDIATARTFGAAPVEPAWLIGSLGERRHLVAATDALRDLVRTGPFWRSDDGVDETEG